MQAAICIKQKSSVAPAVCAAHSKQPRTAAAVSEWRRIVPEYLAALFERDGNQGRVISHQ